MDAITVAVLDIMAVTIVGSILFKTEKVGGPTPQSPHYRLRFYCSDTMLASPTKFKLNYFVFATTALARAALFVSS